MGDVSLDIRTLNFITILFSVIYSVGLLLFQATQKPIKGLSLFSLSILIIGSGPFLISFRGEIPELYSVIGANLLIALGFYFTLYSLSLFREANLIYSRITAALIPFYLLGFIYFTYYEPSINSRVVISCAYLSFATLSTALVTLNGRKEDLSLATRMMAMSFFSFGCFMLVRVFVTLIETEILNFMDAAFVHQLAFLFSIFLIVSMSFSMLWLINARLLRSIHVLSYEDPLTELNNRRALDEAMLEIETQVEQTPVSIIICDIDNFKSINDQFGHLVGDEVVKSVARITLDLLAPQSKAFRLGGDEILVILPCVDLEGARGCAEKIRQSVSQLTLPNHEALRITASFGVAELSIHEHWQDGVERADKALYNSKQNGRNTVSASD